MSLTDKIIEEYIAALLDDKEEVEGDPNMLDPALHENNPRFVRGIKQPKLPTELKPAYKELKPAYTEPTKPTELKKAYKETIKLPILSEKNGSLEPLGIIKRINNKYLVKIKGKYGTYCIPAKKLKQLLNDHIVDTTFHDVDNGTVVVAVMRVDKQILLDNSVPENK